MRLPTPRVSLRSRWGSGVMLLAGLTCLTLHADLSREALFAVPDFSQLPPKTEILSEKTTDGVIVQELFFEGAPFNGQPTRIHAFYTRPAAPGKYPGVVQLHGAGLGTLESKSAVFYARNGFACLSIDWAGPAKERKKPRTPPHSLFESPGNLAAKIEDGQPWKTIGVEKDGITNGVRFVRRSFDFLRHRPEIDDRKLFLSGMSAGAHLSLLVLGVEPEIKGAVIKYGCGYIRDLPGYFGGYFGPLTLAPKAEQDAWLAVLDPKHGIPNYRSRVLMLSGTDDIFFWMPVVLHTWRKIPSAKDLLMLPNDNHTQVWNEEIPLRYYQAILGTKPDFPKPSQPYATADAKGILLQVKVSATSPLTKVEFAIKRMPREKFRYGQDKETGAKWELLPAQKQGSTWQTHIEAVNAGEQLIAYALVEDTMGARASSDTVELPDYPKWRGP